MLLAAYDQFRWQPAALGSGQWYAADCQLRLLVFLYWGYRRRRCRWPLPTPKLVIRTPPKAFTNASSIQLGYIYVGALADNASNNCYGKVMGVHNCNPKGEQNTNNKVLVVSKSCILLRFVFITIIDWLHNFSILSLARFLLFKFGTNASFSPLTNYMYVGHRGHHNALTCGCVSDSRRWGNADRHRGAIHAGHHHI